MVAVVLLVLAALVAGFVVGKLRGETSAEKAIGEIEGVLSEKVRQHNEWAQEMRASWQIDINRANKAEQEYKKLLHQKKSSEVRTGQIAENGLAFVADLPYDFRNMRFLGSPVDYFYFDVSDEAAPKIVVIEVKTGQARETKVQRLLRKAVCSNNISYHLVRISESGVSIKRFTSEHEVE